MRTFLTLVVLIGLGVAVPPLGFVMIAVVLITWIGGGI